MDGSTVTRTGRWLGAVQGKLVFMLIILSFDLSSFFTFEHSFFSLMNFYLDLKHFILI